jgi:5-formyltetrahydrofolate cyclo-ligase
VQSKKELRRLLRHKRRHVGTAEQKNVSCSVVDRILSLPVFLNSQKIAAYISQENEIDLSALIQYALNRQKEIYLPKLMPYHEIKFYSYHGGDTLICNAFNIAEPCVSDDSCIDPMNVDIVLMPLVGFDLTGARLGRGGGYYDQAFQGCLRSFCRSYPLRIGVAYEFQKVSQIKTDSTDVRLDMVVTQETVYDFRDLQS